MNVVIYESSSKGGCYDYSATLFKYYKQNANVERVEWVIPSTTDVSAAGGVHKILCNDRAKFRFRFVSQAAFLFRHFINPLIFFFFLLRKKKKYYVILNDFEQLSVFVWVYLYRLFLSKHTFAVVLHDPDRDAYPPSKKISEICMKIMMSLMRVGFYHEQLPDKNYYRFNDYTEYVKVPFGFYPKKNVDAKLCRSLFEVKANSKYVTILGNIRSEKNYEMAIKMLSEFNQIKLLVAGAPSTSGTDLESLKALAADLKVDDKIDWIIKYLTEEEMSAVIEVSDLILLNYKSSFRSQSAILNSIADHKKKILVSRTQSGLAHIVDQFKLGILVEPDNMQDFLAKLPEALAYDSTQNWSEYLKYASWENNVAVAVEALKRSNDN